MISEFQYLNYTTDEATLNMLVTYYLKFTYETGDPRKRQCIIKVNEITQSTEIDFNNADQIIQAVTFTFEGITKESGKLYFYNITIDGVEKEVKEAITPLFEFARFITPTKTVLFKYNQEISSLKSNYIDVITPTLGGAYPFVRRNGAQKYRSFGLNGLIYCDNSMPQSFAAIERSDTYGAQIALQRAYRDDILNFLQDGQVKLFKSMQEGDMFVYISNVSLTPDKVSGRALYSFSCTATEVCDPQEGYEKYLGGFLI